MDEYEEDESFDGKVYAQNNHPQESHDLVNSAPVISQAKSDQAQCLRLLREASSYGCTNDEIAAWFSEHQPDRIIPVNQLASRVLTLREEGLVVRGASTDRRLTRRNCNARVQYATEYAPVDAERPANGTPPLTERDMMPCPTCDGTGVIDA